MLNCSARAHANAPILCRRLLRNVAVQLVDAHGNAVEAAGVQVRWRLLCADADTGGGGGDAEAPQLCCSGGEVQMASDEQGRAFFGDVAVEQGTGKMVSMRLGCVLGWMLLQHAAAAVVLCCDVPPPCLMLLLLLL